jgi:hypothetical protein
LIRCENFEDANIKGVIRIREWKKDRQCNEQKGKQSFIKTTRKLKIEKHELYWKLRVNLVVPEAEILVTLAHWVQYAYPDHWILEYQLWDILYWQKSDDKTRFWNNIHQVFLKSKDWKAKLFKVYITAATWSLRQMDGGNRQGFRCWCDIHGFPESFDFKNTWWMLFQKRVFSSDFCQYNISHNWYSSIQWSGIQCNLMIDISLKKTTLTSNFN